MFRISPHHGALDLDVTCLSGCAGFVLELPSKSDSSTSKVCLSKYLRPSTISAREDQGAFSGRAEVGMA